MGGGGLDIPGPGSAPGEQAVAFAAELIDRSGKAPLIEAALAHRTGRRRPLPVRAVLTALLCLALDDRPLFLWPCQPQLAPPFSFHVAPHSVAPGWEFSFDLAPAL
jgi:hypothetical protein